MQPIGVFDSGIGGLSVLKALRTELPGERFIYIADSGHAPYGERDDAHVTERSLRLADYLHRRNIKALVVACNTATAAAIDALRLTYPQLPVIGVEPALKPAAAMSRKHCVAVMATRSTLGSARFAALLAAQGSHTRFVAMPGDGLAEAIEQAVQGSKTAEVMAACRRIIGAAIDLTAQPALANATSPFDTLVLGCTHYPFAADHIAALLGPGVQLLDTGEAVARQTRQRLGLTALPQNGSAEVDLISTGNPTALRAAASSWLGLHTVVTTLAI